MHRTRNLQSVQQVSKMHFTNSRFDHTDLYYYDNHHLFIRYIKEDLYYLNALYTVHRIQVTQEIIIV